MITINAELKERLYRSALACQEAYDSPNVGQRYAQAWFKFDREANEAHLAVAGTNDEHDLLKDVSIWKCDVINSAKVHPGVLSYAKLLEEPIYRAIRTANMPTSAKLRISGHSLGAGAVLFLLMRSPLLNDVRYTADLFGCPRVGGIDWPGVWLEMGVGTVVTRVTLKGDPITTCPPALLGWRHVAEELVLKAIGMFNHGIDNYIAAVQRMEVT